MYTISLSDDLSKALQRDMQALSPATMRGILETTGRAVGVAAESIVSDYPPPSGKPLARVYDRVRADGSTYKSKFKSARQQGYVMALVAAGKVPYKRTGQLGRSITSGITTLSERDVTVRIGTNTDYAKYVIGKAEQSNYHRGTWTPLADDVSKGLPVIRQTASTTFGNGIRAAIVRK